MNVNDITTFAETNFRNSRVKFGIKTDDRRRHMYIIGKTGMGKSTLLENMIIQDIQAGKGVCVVDPHGELVEKVIDFIPQNRINDVIYFNPADLEYPIAFNVLESVNIEQRHLVVSGLIGVFKKIWADSWGPRLEYVLHHAISALLEYPGSTLLGIMRMLTDKKFRERVVDKVTDPVVKAFWVDEYSRYPDNLKAEAIAPIQNKVGRFLSSSLIRNVLGQVRSSFSMREIMDGKKILLLNLSKGRVGEDNSALLGSMMITKIQLAAMSRIDTPEQERNDFYLYVDEFQNFATQSFANILSEARKYRLNLIMAHQYIDQLKWGNDETVKSAVFGNVGTIIAFRVGATDAEFLEKEFFPVFTQEDLVNLSKYEIYLKLMVDGVATEPFSGVGLPPVILPAESIGIKEKVIKVSRERYAKPREIIEDKIARWAENKEGKEPEKNSKEDRVKKSKKKGDEERKSGSKKPKISKIINCTYCGKEAEINFEPDPTRPVYCDDCLILAKQGKIPSPTSIKILKEESASKKVDDDQTKEQFISLSEAIKSNNLHSGKEKSKQVAEDEHLLQPGQIVKF
ncbi:MAG: type IV secretion system DNA-binding domain-containing protein [Patescibacteria group bacterium]